MTLKRFLYIIFFGITIVLFIVYVTVSIRVQIPSEKAVVEEFQEIEDQSFTIPLTPATEETPDSIFLPSVVSPDILSPKIDTARDFLKENFVAPQELPEDNQTIQKRTPSTPALSEEEIFDHIWPPAYIQGLRDIEGVMIQVGFIKEDGRNPFSKDQDIYDFYHLMFKQAYANKWITDTEFNSFTKRNL